MDKKKLKTIKLINNIFFYAAVAFSGYVLLTTYIVRSKLPAGVCPINNNQMLFYISIGILLISFFASIVIDYKWKKIIKAESLAENTTNDQIDHNPEENETEQEKND